MSKRRRRKAATPTTANLLPAKYTDPKKLIEQLVDYLIQQVPVFDESARKSKKSKKSKSKRIEEKIAAQERYLDDSSIASGKEDLTSGLADLFGVLDSIRDSDEQRKAYLALYYIVWGVFRIAKGGMLPFSVEQHSQVARARVMRWCRKQPERRTKLDLRKDIVLAAIAEYENETHGESPSVERMLIYVTKRLTEAGHKPKIGIRTLYRYLKNR